MIGVDTNVLARLFVEDDARQSHMARSFFAQRNANDPAFVSLVVAAELVWLLDRTYDYPKSSILDALKGLLDSPDFVVERRELLESALSIATSAKKAGIADAIISLLAEEAACLSTITFDHDASRHVPGMELLK